MPDSLSETLPSPSWADRAWRSSDGLRLHARDYAGASGPARLAVVCIHGLTRNARDFEDLAPVLAADGRRVLAIDVRGRGASDRDPNPVNYNAGVYAQDVATMMQALGLARAQFIGTSMGGLITMALAASQPDLVAGAVLNDIGPVFAPEGLARIGRYAGQAAPVNDWRQASAHVRLVNGPIFPAYQAAEWDRMARRLFREGGDGRPELDYDLVVGQQLRDAAQPLPELWPLYTALAANRPLTIIRGGASDLLNEATVQGMRQIAPHARYAEVPGVGHAPMLDEPEALAAIREHLAQAD